MTGNPIRRATRHRRFQSVLPCLVIVGMFTIWEIAVHGLQIPEFVLPAPSAIMQSIVRWWSPLLDNAWHTLVTTAIGFAFAVMLGLVLGVAIHQHSPITAYIQC